MGLFLCLPLTVQAEDTKGKEQKASQSAEDSEKAYVRKLEKRVSDLEAVVRQLIEERKGPSGQPQVSTAVEEKKPAAASGTGDDEWGEPVVRTETAKGRDDEARRRLSELETWKKKTDAKTAKEAEESADKVRFDFSGKYKLRYNVRNNLNLNNPLQFWQFDNSSYFDQRYQLGVTAEYGPLSSVLILDKGNFVFDWKQDSEGTLERWGEFQTVTSALVRELYVQYIGNFVVKAGRQSLLVGNGGIVFEGPADAFKVTYPIGQTPIGRASATLAYIAVSGGFKDYTDFRKTGPPAGDRRAVLGLPNKLDGWLLSLDIKPQRDLTISPYALKVFDRGKFGDPDLNLDRDFDLATSPRDGSFEPLWLGVALSGKSGAFSYKGDAIYLTGPFTNTRNLSAYAVLARGDYLLKKAGPLDNLTLGLELGRGSGNTAEEKIAGTGTSKDFIGLFLCKERRKFGNIFSEDLRAGFFFADSNLSNVTFVRAIAEFEPVSKLKTNISLAKFWTTQSVFKGRGPIGDWSQGTSASTEKTHDIGWEADLNFDFPIYKRLRGFAELGYFVPGAAYNRADGRAADPASEIVLGAEFEF